MEKIDQIIAKSMKSESWENEILLKNTKKVKIISCFNQIYERMPKVRALGVRELVKK